MNATTCEDIEVLMLIDRETPFDLLDAAVNDQAKVLVCIRGYEKRKSKTVLVSRAEMQTDSGTIVLSDALDWGTLCALTADSTAYVGDRKGDTEDASTVRRFNPEGELVTEFEVPMTRIWAMDVTTDGRYLACAGFDAGSGFGPQDEDIWIFDTESLDAPPVQTPNPHRSNVDVLKWAASGDWFLTQAPLARDNHYNFAVQTAGTKKPLWRGKGRGAVVIGNQVAVWSTNGGTIEVWEPGQKDPVHQHAITIDGKQQDGVSFAGAPHNMASIDGGAKLVLTTTTELWVVDMQTGDLLSRHNPRPWTHYGLSNCWSYASPNGEYIAFWFASQGRGVVIESKHLTA